MRNSMPAAKYRRNTNSTNRLAFLRIAPGLIHLARGVFFGSSRNPGKDRNKNADLMDDVRASKHINKP
ncbi:hypothetical protein, partial [Pseudomonas plecoglossicida]|uniref:hypothetical protein n=1 Tax=Pseudomonas plecoglossicida TaxID=70775 RepID=UPI003D25D4DF